MKFKCLRCRKIFYDSPSSKRKYCSKSCNASAAIEAGYCPRLGHTKSGLPAKSIFQCFECSKKFEAWTSEHPKYCSRECFHVALNRKLKNRTGEKNPAYKGDLSVERQKREWRDAVFARDKRTCRNCGNKNCRIRAHHIKTRKDRPDLIFDITNGKTLCVSCHSRTHILITNAKIKQKRLLRSAL